jgi:hypothetical protein
MISTKKEKRRDLMVKGANSGVGKEFQVNWLNLAALMLFSAIVALGAVLALKYPAVWLFELKPDMGSYCVASAVGAIVGFIVFGAMIRSGDISEMEEKNAGNGQ